MPRPTCEPEAQQVVVGHNLGSIIPEHDASRRAEGTHKTEEEITHPALYTVPYYKGIRETVPGKARAENI